MHPSDIAFRERGIEGVAPPWVPGWDAAGTVESVGPGVDGLAVGDAVMAVVSPRRPEGGAQSQLLVVPAASVVPVPAGASFEQASTLPMNGLTALRGLELLDLAAGATLLVTGGAGLLASYAIPLAKRAGLRVLADAGPADEECVRGFGADVVLPRGEGLVAGGARSRPRRRRRGLRHRAARTRDLPGHPGRRRARRSSGPGPARASRTASRSTRVWVGDVLERTEWLRELSQLAGEGVLALRVAATFPPERAADAQRLMEAGGLRGRAVVVFD